MSGDLPARTVGECYRSVRSRLGPLLADLDEAAWEVDVPATPGWRVRDVLAHLVGNCEDAAAGRLTGPPDEAMTAEQVERHSDDDPAMLLARWHELAPDFEHGVTALGIWPAFIDVWSHEHDVRGALGQPGSRDDQDTRDVFILVSGGWRPDPAPQGPVVLATDLGDRTLYEGPSGAPVITLDASAFEVNRLRLGRRSEEQVRAMAWSEPPGPWLPELFAFGPRAEPLDW